MTDLMPPRTAEWIKATTGERARVLEQMNAHARQFTRAMRALNQSAASAHLPLQRLSEQMKRDWASYRARWARKRTPRYLAKGGVRK